jgi:N-acyl-D-amino-acid deacylase
MWHQSVISWTQSKTRTLIAVAFILLLGLAGASYLWLKHRRPTCSGEFDLVVAGAEIIDGLGGPAFKSDIGIRDKRVSCIGTFDLSKVTHVIDATGLTVAPGFIDVHTHVEPNVPTSSAFQAHNFVRQGVTTLITGNCGRSFLDIGKLFHLLEKNGSQINVASLVGHNTVRFQVMKESASAPTQEQLNQMKALVKTAMRDGALGLSTGLEYIPGAFAKTDEIVELAKTVKENNGLYASHIRNEGMKGIDAIREAISVGERTGIHVHISHFKAQGPNQWGSAQQRLDLVRSAENQGLVVSLDQYPYTASSTGIGILLPSWVSEGGLSAARQRLGDPAKRKQIRDEMLDRLRELGWKDYSFARVAFFEPDRSLIGLNIVEIAQRKRDVHSAKGQAAIVPSKFDPSKQFDESDLEREADVVIDIFSRGGAQMVFFNMSEKDVETIMEDPEVMFGSDSAVREEDASVLPHPRGFGTFPRVLGVYARQKHLFSIEEAVRRMTSLPAETFGLKDRGQIRPGFWADLLVFDRDRVVDTSTYDKPLSNPEGIYYVVVNGSLVLDNGRITKDEPGIGIRRN